MSNDQQRTEQWFKDREGKLTASSFAAAAGLGPGSRQQAWRRFFGLETFEGNAATDWGTDNEPKAIAEYTARHLAKGVDTHLVGFVPHPTMAWLGCSPDLLVGDQGLAEIKCPMSQELYGDIPPYYMAQIQGQLEVTQREWCDFVVWTPSVVSVQRVMRSQSYWQWLHVRLAEFWMYVEAGVEPPRMKREQPPVTDDLIVATVTYQLN